MRMPSRESRWARRRERVSRCSSWGVIVFTSGILSSRSGNVKREGASRHPHQFGLFGELCAMNGIAMWLLKTVRRLVNRDEKEIGPLLAIA